MKKNYYQILQVDQKASIEVIEKVYKTLAKKYHPDLQSKENKTNNEEILKDINEAYETLSNPDKRQAYDEMLIQSSESTGQSFQNNLNNPNNYANIKNVNNIKKRKKSIHDYVLDLIAIIITFFILFLLLQIPFIRNIFSDNIIIKNISNLLQLSI